MAVYAALFYIIIRTGKIYIQAAVFKYDNGTKNLDGITSVYLLRVSPLVRAWLLIYIFINE